MSNSLLIVCDGCPSAHTDEPACPRWHEISSIRTFAHEGLLYGHRLLLESHRISVSTLPVKSSMTLSIPINQTSSESTTDRSAPIHNSRPIRRVLYVWDVWADGPWPVFRLVCFDFDARWFSRFLAHPTACGVVAIFFE